MELGTPIHMVGVMNEAAIQRSIVDYLRAVLRKDYRCFAIPNAAQRTRGGRAANAVAGLTAGVPDLAIVGRGEVFFIEVKTPHGIFSDGQEEFLAWCAIGGTSFCVARSIDDVRIALSQWNIPTREGQPLSEGVA